MKCPTFLHVTLILLPIHHNILSLNQMFCVGVEVPPPKDTVKTVVSISLKNSFSFLQCVDETVLTGDPNMAWNGSS